MDIFMEKIFAHYGFIMNYRYLPSYRNLLISELAVKS